MMYNTKKYNPRKHQHPLTLWLKEKEYDLIYQIGQLGEVNQCATTVIYYNGVVRTIEEYKDKLDFDFESRMIKAYTEAKAQKERNLGV